MSAKPKFSAHSKMEALRKTAAILAQQFDVQVIFQGNSAYTDGKRIVVPSLPEDADPELIDAITGFVDHETGHILETDMTFKKPFTDKDKRVQGLTNAIEDLRMEARMVERYRGMGLNFERTMVWAMDKVSASWDMNPDEMFKLTAAMMMRSKHYQGFSYAKPFHDKHAGPYKEVLDLFDDEIREMHKLPSVQASYECAKRILKLLDETHQAPEQQEQQQGGKGKPKKGEKQQPGKGDEQPKPKKGGESEPKPGKGEKDEDGEQEQPGDGEGEGEDEQEQPGSGQGGDEEGEGQSDGDEEGDGEGQAGAGEDEQGEDGESPQQPLSEEALQLIAKVHGPNCKTSGGLHEAVQNLIIDESTTIRGPHRILTDEFDRTVTPYGADQKTLADYTNLQTAVQPYINVLQSVLVKTLLARTKARTLHGRSTGMISLNSIGRLKAGDPNIFKKRKEGLDLDTYVEVLIDHSGSMDGPKIKTAAMTCIALAEALDRVGVTFGISGFTAGYGETGMTEAEALVMRKVYENLRNYDNVYKPGGKLSSFSRLEPIVEYCYKRAEEPYQHIKTRLAAMMEQDMQGNCDPDSILRVAKRVIQRKEKRRIIMVLSDGLPAYGQGCDAGVSCHQHLKNTCEMLERTPGIELIGIGILTDAPRKYYKRSIIVNSIEALPELAMTEIKRVLQPEAKVA